MPRESVHHNIVFFFFYIINFLINKCEQTTAADASTVAATLTDSWMSAKEHSARLQSQKKNKKKGTTKRMPEQSMVRMSTYTAYVEDPGTNVELEGNADDDA